jgi:hypothetical protein
VLPAPVSAVVLSDKTFDVEVCPWDFEDDTNETFFVDLTNPQNAGFGDPLGVGTIIPPDQECPISLVNPGLFACKATLTR